MDAASLLGAIVECSDDAIVSKKLDGTVLSWNRAAERIFGWTAEEMVGASIRRLIPPERQAEEDAILASVTAGERVPTFETVRQCKDGSAVFVTLTVSPVRDASGRVVAASHISRDLTEHKRVAQALADSEWRFRLMADNISQLAWIAAGDGTVTWFNRRWRDYTGADAAETARSGWQQVVHPDHLARAEDKFVAAAAAGVAWEDILQLRGADGTYRWFLSQAQPLIGPDGRASAWFGTNTDITQQREAERRIELLMLEVNHRAKNMLAMIQSLARRTLSGGGAQHHDFVNRLEQRIASLVASQDLLVSRAWQKIPLGELAEVQLAFLGEALDQVQRHGPELEVTPTTAETIGMALHELATNALKYGALSRSSGRVALTWSRTDDGGLAMEWRETGGPAVTPPEGRGFGGRLIVEAPRAKLGAEVSTDYRPEGFVWTLRTARSGVLA